MSDETVPLQSYIRANDRCVELLAERDELLEALCLALQGHPGWEEHVRAAIAKAEDANLPTAKDVRGILKAEGK